MRQIFIICEPRLGDQDQVDVNATSEIKVSTNGLLRMFSRISMVLDLYAAGCLLERRIEALLSKCYRRNFHIEFDLGTAMTDEV